MEEEIVAVFNKSGFAIDEEEILKKCKPHFAHLPLNFLAMLLVQMGPLLDSEHSEIKKGIVGRSFDELFCLEILSPEALHITSIPDFLILPSDMKYFIKLVSLVEGQGQRKSICINPGRLAKGGGSTFAELKYHGTAGKMNTWIIVGI